MLVALAVAGVVLLAGVVAFGLVVKHLVSPSRPDAAAVATVDATMRLDPVAGGTAVRLSLVPTPDSATTRLRLDALTVDRQYVVAGDGGPGATRAAIRLEGLRADGRAVRRGQDGYGPIAVGPAGVALTFTVPAVGERRVLLPLNLGDRVRVRDLRVEAAPGLITSCLRLTGYDGSSRYDVMTRCDPTPPLRPTTTWPADPSRQGVVRLELGQG